MGWTQDSRPIAVKTPLGDNALMLRSFTYSESLGRPFTMSLSLVSENHAISHESVLGQNITVRLNRVGGEPRYFNAYISRFEQSRAAKGGLAGYEAVAVPWIWFLGQSSNCRAWQDQTVPEVIKTVMRERGFGSFKERLQGSFKPREYCVQYRESDLDFVTRLCEHEGIYWYTTHRNGEHTLVFSNGKSGHERLAVDPDLQFLPGTASASQKNAVTQWRSSRTVQSGAAAMSDYDFENPATSLLAQVKTPGKHQFGDFETFEYHGAYSKASQGDALSRIRVEEHRSGAEEFVAETVCRSIDVGSKFNLSGHPRQDQNAEYLVTSVVIEANAGDFDASNQGGDFSHRTTLRAIRSQTAFRLARTVPPPMINGPQSAVVVGPSGQEIHTDKHGRIRVRFFWDRYAKGDETSSCWVRVSQPWAGKKWGGFFLPRIGHEVLVEFLGGDPERPVVTGSLYNGENAPPYALPGKQTVSTIKSLSSPGGGGFNELRFEDKKGSEQIFIHGEKDWDRRIKKDAKDWIGGDHHMMVIKDSFTDIKGDQHESVTGDRKEKVGMNASLKVGMNLDEKVGMNYALQSGMQMHLKAGLSLVIEAGMMITLKAGGGFITVGPTGVCISGTPVLINSGGAAGSGAGASPAPPTPAKEADNDKSGQATKAVKPPRPPKPTTYSPAAMVLKQAAKSGTPFCKQCAKQ